MKSILHIQLQGGDFFLHKDALKLIQYVAQEEKFINCSIATNCIIIPRQNILEILKNPKFTVRISHYGAANEKNENILIDKLKDNNIKYLYHQYANNNGYWSYCGDINTPQHTKTDTVDNYLNCIFKICTTLENGEISRCSRAKVAHFVQNFKPKPNDLINLRSPFFSISKLKKFIKIKDSRKGIVEACFYCNGTSGKKIQAGEQLSKAEYSSIIKPENRHGCKRERERERERVIPLIAYKQKEYKKVA